MPSDLSELPVESREESVIGTRRGAGRRELAVVGSLLFVAAALWALASPLMSAPDEPAHATKAAGMWQGVALGEPVRYPPNPGETRGPLVYEVRAPLSYASANSIFLCFALKPEVTPDCAPDLLDGDRTVDVETAAGSYPPLYYVLVGWPSRLVDADVGLYLMRLVSAAIATGFMVVGYACLRRLVGRATAAAALVVAATPQVLFLNGSISPNSLEVATGFALWTALLALVVGWRRDEPLDRRLVAAVLVSGIVLVNTRPLSVLFALMIGGIVLAYAGWAAVRSLAGDRRAWAIVGSLALGVVPAAVWALSWGQATSATGGGTISTEQNVLLTLVASSDDWFSQMIAHFGWLDTGPVLVAVWAWLAIVVLFVGLAAGSGGAWRSSVLAATVAFVVAAPVIMQYPSARNGHVAWQGRYFLVVAVGVPVLAAVTLSLRQVGPILRARLYPAIAVLAGVAAIASHMAATRRYVVGTSGRLNYLSGGNWSPPLPTWLLLVATVAVCGAVVALMIRLTASEPDEPEAEAGSFADADVRRVPVATAIDDLAPFAAVPSGAR